MRATQIKALIRESDNLFTARANDDVEVGGFYWVSMAGSKRGLVQVRRVSKRGVVYGVRYYQHGGQSSEIALTRAMTPEEIEYRDAVRARADRWVPAAGGTETWTPYRNGGEYLYVFNPATGKHGWLDRGDIVHEQHPNDGFEKHTTEEMT